MKFYVTKQKSDFLLFKCPEKGKFVSPETGDEFCVDDVVGGFEELFSLFLLQCCNTLVEKMCLVVCCKVEAMSESDDMLSSVNSNSSYSSREESVEPPSTSFLVQRGNTQNGQMQTFRPQKPQREHEQTYKPNLFLFHRHFKIILRLP